MSEVEEIINSDRPISEKVDYLTRKTIKVPAWGKLEKQYDKRKHAVKDDPEWYGRNRDGKSKSKQKPSIVTLGWQKLSTKRMAALMFGIEAKRVYNAKDDLQKRAAKAIEKIYDRNRIKAVNLERAQKLYACCEIMTLWFCQEQETMYGEEKSKLKLRCKTFSPMSGDELYPLFDEYDDMVALSVRYTRTENQKSVTYFDTYTANKHICWNVTDQVEVMNEDITIEKIPGVYLNRPEPIWEDETDTVTEAEYTLSRQGNYIRKNSRPKLAAFTDGNVKANKSENPDAASEILRFGKDDRLEYVTWNGSSEATKDYVETLKHEYNSQLQLPDMSMDNMKTTPMSGESRKMLFMDSQMKVTYESGIWEEGLDREFNIIKAYAKIMFPGLADAIDTLTVTYIITPYQINDEKDNVETLATAAGTIASTRTCVERLGWAEDPDEEVRMIEEGAVEDVFSPAE